MRLGGSCERLDGGFLPTLSHYHFTMKHIVCQTFFSHIIEISDTHFMGQNGTPEGDPYKRKRDKKYTYLSWRQIGIELYRNMLQRYGTFDLSLSSSLQRRRGDLVTHILYGFVAEKSPLVTTGYLFFRPVFLGIYLLCIRCLLGFYLFCPKNNKKQIRIRKRA